MSGDQGPGSTKMNRPSTQKSHPNDSEPQLKESMKNQPPNQAPQAKSPKYSVKDGKVINELDNSVAAEGGDDEELQKTADQMNEGVKKAREQADQQDEEARQKQQK